ncbi:MAG: hypothetical protein ACR2KP_15010 [Egibacteraceae bacterium]
MSRAAKDQEHRSGMEAMTRRQQEHYLQPTEGAASPETDPFPSAVLTGLWLGACIGVLTGAVFGALLVRGAVAVPGWERMFSIGANGMVVMWVFFGVAAGVATIAVGALFAAGQQEQSQRRPTGEQGKSN